MSDPQKKVYVSIAAWARQFGVSEATARNYIARGFFPVYKMRGRRGALVNVEEANQSMRLIPKAKARGKSYAQFGPNAVVRHVVEAVES